MSERITRLVMPKWGLEMREGAIAAWLVEEGARLEVGKPVVDVETDKISNTMEAPDAGLLRRRVAAEGQTLPVKALLAVLAEPDVPDAEIDSSYIRGFVEAAGRRELKPVVEKLFADPSLVTRQLVDDLLKYKRLDGVSDGLSRLASSLFAEGRQPAQPARKLDTKATPTLVVWGEADRIVPAAHAAHAPPGAAVHVLSGAGHMVMMEKAGEVNALLPAHVGGGGR